MVHVPLTFEDEHSSTDCMAVPLLRRSTGGICANHQLQQAAFLVVRAYLKIAPKKHCFVCYFLLLTAYRFDHRQFSGLCSVYKFASEAFGIAVLELALPQSCANTALSLWV
jgi:hypothetical protein